MEYKEYRLKPEDIGKSFHAFANRCQNHWYKSNNSISCVFFCSFSHLHFFQLFSCCFCFVSMITTNKMRCVFCSEFQQYLRGNTFICYFFLHLLVLVVLLSLSIVLFSLKTSSEFPSFFFSKIRFQQIHTNLLCEQFSAYSYNFSNKYILEIFSFRRLKKLEC